MKLIEDWRKAWKMFSVQAMALCAALQGAWVAMPPDLQARIPSAIVSGLSITLLVLGLVGRLIDQPAVSSKGDAP